MRDDQSGITYILRGSFPGFFLGAIVLVVAPDDYQMMMDEDGWLWKAVQDGLPWLLTVVSLIVASRCYAPTLAALLHWPPTTTPTTSGESVPTLDGHHLYYGKTKWPQYEARFNLRLSYIYGPVVTIKLGATNLAGKLRCWLNRCLVPGWQPADTTILINSLAEDDGTLRSLLNSCASRNLSIPAGKYLSGGRRIVLQPYGPDWQRHRRAFASLLTKEKVKNSWSRAVCFEALVMVDRLARLTSVEDVSDMRLLKEVSRFTASNVLQIAYARRASTPEDLVLGELEIVSQNISSAFTPGKYLVEKFPMLDWLPFFVSPWKRKLNKDHEFEKDLFTRLLQGVDAKLKASPASQTSSESVISVDECAAAQLLQNCQSLQLDRDDVAYLAAGLFEAGTETTAMTINTFLLAAACYPEVVQKAQAAMDVYLRGKYGEDMTLPEFEDLQKMEYLGAVAKETLRLTPTGSSGVGHTPSGSAVQSLHLTMGGEGRQRRLDVPPDATVLGNTYGLHHDPKVFSDPWGFDPARWLDTKPDQDASPPALETSTPRNALDHSHRNAHYFGFGRRICPGGTLASYTLSMAIALLVFCFDFELTAKAQEICVQMEDISRKEGKDWASLYPSRGEGIEQEDEIGRVLMDAHIAFQLSKSQLAECIRLRPRGDASRGDRLRAVGDALAAMQTQSGR